jgi:hypothetical protein
MLCEDGNPYVVKFQNNPQNIRVLANEFIATRLAAAIGLPVPQSAVIEVAPWLIENTPELYMDCGVRRDRCAPGLCFGSRFIGGLFPGQLFDYLPEEDLRTVTNVGAFAGALAFDKWTCNSDGRQAVFTKKQRERRFTATFIDFGYCFNAGEWVFRDSPLRGIFGRKLVYDHVTAWRSLEPWLGRIENLDGGIIWDAVRSVPSEWYGGDFSAVEALVERLLARRLRVRELVESYRKSSHAPFPNWGELDTFQGHNDDPH